MSDKTFNIAIVGLGFGAEFIPIHQAHPNANLVAVCRRNEAEMNAVADEFNIEKRYTDYDELLKDPEIDAVHINSPIPDHAPQSIKALRAGKHVMCTVPMATTSRPVTTVNWGTVSRRYQAWVRCRAAGIGIDQAAPYCQRMRAGTNSVISRVRPAP